MPAGQTVTLTASALRSLGRAGFFFPNPSGKIVADYGKDSYEVRFVEQGKFISAFGTEVIIESLCLNSKQLSEGE